ncbi:PRD domain-containing protein [Konateibacter massiliensis]|uniref:PRD domain-containing protein n=1 Tax=Konateibacter massiliensis TaxID=2002841 RepID=UPI000C161B8C|nr:PRD domain-containing protein [Konateibacter massiliensis]
MKLLKKINNNFALALDSYGEEIIVSGKGVGFMKMPCELEDLSQISRTFYDINDKYIELINEIPEEVLKVSIEIVDYAKRKLGSKLNPNLIFTLADHLNFAIDRHKKGITFDFPLSYDFRLFYEKEIDVGKYALKIIESKMNIKLPKEEITGIAMNIVNSELYLLNGNAGHDSDKLMEGITKIVENYFNIEINKETASYSRFVSHLQCLFKRIAENKSIASENKKLLLSMIEEVPEAYECVLQISNYLNRKKNWILDEEETLYLMLHVNRVCSREDCYRQGITSET